MTDETKKKAWGFARYVAAALLTAVITGLSTYFGFPQRVEVPVEVPVVAPAHLVEEFEARAQGWVRDPDSVAEHVKAFGVPAFGDTPAGRALLADPRDVYLWDAAKKATGSVLPARDQKSVGSCVSFG